MIGLVSRDKRIAAFLKIVTVAKKNICVFPKRDQINQLTTNQLDLARADSSADDQPYRLLCLRPSPDDRRCIRSVYRRYSVIVIQPAVKIFK